MTNPLLETEGLPAFSDLRPEHVEPAVDSIISENRDQLARLLGHAAPGWDTIVEPLEELEDRLQRTWAPASHMNSVCNSPDWRAAYNACIPKLTDYATELSQHSGLHAAYRAVRDTAGPGQLSASQRKLLDDALRDFRLAGVDLPAEKKTQFRSLSQFLAEAESHFEDNVLDATHAWHLDVADESDLDGIPAADRARARERAGTDGFEGWRFGLDFPSFKAIVTYAESRDLRRQIFQAYVTRASDQGPTAGDYDNTAQMLRILRIRRQLADLVGFANYAEYALASRMAQDTGSVIDFITDLLERVRPAALSEFRELQEFARTRNGPQQLAPWDIAYYSERLRQERYAVSQEALRPWFPIDRVLQGLFTIVGRLYGIRVSKVPAADVWHPSVGLYAIHDAAGDLRGHLYTDLYARKGKRGGAWMDGCISRHRRPGALQRPAAFLVCNFGQPVKGHPTLLTHDDVLTLFHEFGHCLHHLLTTVDYPSIAGTHGVEWDAVELPSQFHENFCWARACLDVISGHHETGEPLPKHEFDRLLAARNFQSAMKLVRQLEFALFDFRLHLADPPDTGDTINRILADVRTQVAVVPIAEFDRFAHAFSHIFGGGYAAGYYSYLWAEVLSADAFAAFPEDHVLDPVVGQRFLEAVLETGGSRKAIESFMAFRGREQKLDAFLRAHGIDSEAESGARICGE